MISTGTMIVMVGVGLLSVLLPFIFILALRRKFKIQWLPILIGAGIFILFAMVLEQISHMLILRPEADGTIPLITGAPWLHALTNLTAAMVQAGLLTNIWLMYAGFILMTLVTLWIAYNTGLKNRKTEVTENE